MPSAASSNQSRSRGGLARPDTAPGSTKRSVRFSDELGLDDDLLGSERPSTAPSERSSRRQQRRDEGDVNISGSSQGDDKKPPPGSKPTRRETKGSGGYCLYNSCLLGIMNAFYAGSGEYKKETNS